MATDSSNLLDFILESERLKMLLRHSWLSNDRRESVAEHTWRMMLMALVYHRQLDQPVDLAKVLKLCLVHDLPEAITTDYPAFKKQPADKAEQEERAISQQTQSLPKAERTEIRQLWREYEDCLTLEARFAKALDKLEVQIQHAQADLKHQNQQELAIGMTYGAEFCAYDSFLIRLRQQVRDQTTKQYQRGGVDPKFYESDAS